MDTVNSENIAESLNKTDNEIINNLNIKNLSAEAVYLLMKQLNEILSIKGIPSELLIDGSNVDKKKAIASWFIEKDKYFDTRFFEDVDLSDEQQRKKMLFDCQLSEQEIKELEDVILYKTSSYFSAMILFNHAFNLLIKDIDIDFEGNYIYTDINKKMFGVLKSITGLDISVLRSFTVKELVIIMTKILTKIQEDGFTLFFLMQEMIADLTKS